MTVKGYKGNIEKSVHFDATPGEKVKEEGEDDS